MKKMDAFSEAACYNKMQTWFTKSAACFASPERDRVPYAFGQDETRAEPVSETVTEIFGITRFTGVLTAA
jgi:hypothetical protein